MRKMSEEWIRIYSYKNEPEKLEDYIIETEGCGCCVKTKSSPTKEDLDILEKYLEDQIEMICYLRDKYGMN